MDRGSPSDSVDRAGTRERTFLHVDHGGSRRRREWPQATLSIVALSTLIVLAALAGAHPGRALPSRIFAVDRGGGNLRGFAPSAAEPLRAPNLLSQRLPAIALPNSVSDGPAVVASVGVGTYPDGVAFDTAKGEMFVTNYYSNSVSVVSDATDTVVATVPVGSQPFGVTYDPGKSEAFVENYDSGNVSVISDATNSVVATIPVGSFPSDPAFDAATDEVFVPNYNSNNVSVIDDATDTVVATIPVGSYPAGAAYDPATGQVFVPNAGSNNVSLIDGTTDKVVGAVQVGLSPVGAAYDPVRDEVFVLNGNSANVSVINATTDAVMATVPVGSGPSEAAYDAAMGEVFVTDSASNSVSVIDDATDAVAATIMIGFKQVGAGPIGVADDTSRGELFVTNAGWNDVSIISDGSASSFTVTFTISPTTCGSITFDGAAYTNGQSVQVSAGTYPLYATACSGDRLASLVGTGPVAVSSGKATVRQAGGIEAKFTSSTSSPGSELWYIFASNGYFMLGGIVTAVTVVTTFVLFTRWTKRKHS